MSTYLPYSADSFYRQPLHDSAPVDQARTTAFRAFMKRHTDQKPFAYPTIKGLGTNKWGTVWAEADDQDPIWKLTGFANPKANVLKDKGFHAPMWFGEILTGSSDSPFGVMDFANRWTVFGTKASKTAPQTITVQSAGLTYHGSNGLDGKESHSNDKRNTTSRGRISDAMVIRADLVKQGVANGTGLGHVLHLFLCETSTTDGHCPPMVGHESGKNGFGAEGERIRIDPSVDLTRRGLSPTALVVARTLQTHGCYFGDNAGRESTLKAQQNNVRQNPWQDLAGMSEKMLAGITWDDFVVIKRGWPIV